jgi:DNA-binding beta-propeller fold protein YncE
MSNRILLAGTLALVAVIAPLPINAQVEDELVAKSRLFPDAGAGLRAVRRDAAGNYYVLTAPGPVVLVYDASGKLVKKVPDYSTGKGPASPQLAAISFGEDLDVDAGGRVYVADRGDNAIKVFLPDGSAQMFQVNAPASVAALGNGEIAVTTLHSARLVTVFDLQGKVVREFGDPTELADRKELNRFLNIGRLATDGESHIYYAFSYLPEPTVRKYDRFGYAAFEINLTTLEFQPTAQAARREIERQERGGTPTFKPVVTACGVDPATQEIWVALHGFLLHFDREGNRRGTYRTYTPEGGRLEATSILVEPTRLLLGANPLGVFEFSRPDKKQP